MQSRKHSRMIWNVTYNDAQRWNEVHAIAGERFPWMKSITESIRGRAIGSPKLDLEALTGLEELERLRIPLNQRTSINFQRTTHGFIAYTKVRLEVYAIPLRFVEVTSVQTKDSGSTQAILVLDFQRSHQKVTLTMKGARKVVDAAAEWFKMASRSGGQPS